MEVFDDLQAALAGRYQILRELGRGGMAVVYLARDLKHERDVAIKVLPPELATAVGAERFVREIRTAAQLAHPNILPLHDSIAVGQLRCYVMPYVAGESLRQRLDRERQLGIEQAVDIVRQVAAGLDYAHGHGVVHRDIKPENILLVGDQALIADFGLARALHVASSAPFTESGIAVGTPAYMSPEQSAAEPVDGRTDVYALGCVFFEMVAGVPPFRGATVQALMAAHATREPPSLCQERESCPEAMDAAVQRALAKVPADRFRTAGEFAHALLNWRSSTRPPLPVRRRRVWLAWGAAVAALAGVGVLTPALLARARDGGAAMDSTAVAVLPFSGSGGQKLTAPVARARLLSAFAGWNALRVVDVGDSLHGDARSVARRAGAGRYVTASMAYTGDSVNVLATLFDTGSVPLRQKAIRIPDDARAVGSSFQLLAASLLRAPGSAGDPDEEDSNPGTSNVIAWQAFTRGQQARAEWRLDDAEREFRRAVTQDPSFARAQLWLGQVVLWQHPRNEKAWGEAAGHAMALAGHLSRRDSLLAAGLVDLSSHRYPEACAAYRSLRTLSPESDLPWYGLGYCLGFDPLVLPSRTSPSGWRFRSEPMMAVAAFDSALAHAEGAPDFAFRMLGMLRVTEPLQMRVGRSAPPAATLFYATPSIAGDTIAMLPVPASEVERGLATPRATRAAALQRNVRGLESEYREWVRRAPRSTDAWTAWSGVQELQGDSAAIGSLQHARGLSVQPHERIVLSAAMVRLLVKWEHFAKARDLADSLVRGNVAAEGEDAAALAGVAALIGDVSSTQRLLGATARAQPSEVFQTRLTPPPTVLDEGVRYLVGAASGICDDSLRRAPERIDALLVKYATTDERAELRRALVTRPLMLSVPCLGAGAVLALPPVNRLVRMQQAVATGNVRALKLAFDSLRIVRTGLRPGDVALDHTFQEAWLLVLVHDSAAASTYLDLPLTSLSTLDTHLLNEVPASAALGRALALRADLAAAAGDRPTARRFASALAALWSGASPALQPVVRRMQGMSAPSTVARMP